MSDASRLRPLLAAIRAGDERGVVMSSDVLADDLGWSATDVAQALREAKAAMLVWGLRTGGSPQPHFDEIELTVQGNRYLRAPSEPT
jgi:hypothetical protein